jgi:hypothetical protein
MLFLLQASLVHFSKAANTIRTVLWLLVDSDDGEAGSAGKQLLCGKTCALMTRVVSVMLSTLQALQVLSPPRVLPQCKAGCPPGAHTPTCVATMYRWLHSRCSPLHIRVAARFS